jgi:hypothetical protein
MGTVEFSLRKIILGINEPKVGDGSELRPWVF